MILLLESKPLFERFYIKCFKFLGKSSWQLVYFLRSGRMQNKYFCVVWWKFCYMFYCQHYIIIIASEFGPYFILQLIMETVYVPSISILEQV